MSRGALGLLREPFMITARMRSSFFAVVRMSSSISCSLRIHFLSVAANGLALSRAASTVDAAIELSQPYIVAAPASHVSGDGEAGGASRITLCQERLPH